jgi:conflict system STAND superfamily ATPase
VDNVVTSPIATGGGGERFEQHLDAFALALLLARSISPIITDATVCEVHFQTRRLGWRTDDLLIVGEVQPGVSRKLAIQAKRDFTIAAADEDCIETIRGMWDDFIDADRFNPDVDRFAVATLHGTSTLLASFTSLLDCARASIDSEDFQRRLKLTKYLSRKAHQQNDALLAILSDRVTEGMSDERYWRFLRVLNVLSFDLGTTTAQTEVLVRSLLAHIADGAGDPVAAARQTWLELLEFASKGREGAASYRRDSLPSPLLDRHGVIASADERARLDLIAHGKVVRDAVRVVIGSGRVLDRSAQAAALLDELDLNRITIVTGAAGAGKSALVRSLADRIEHERPVLAFQAVEFATPHINETLSKTQASLNAPALVALLAAHDETLIVIDGIERLLEHAVRDAFTHLLQIAARTPSLRVLLTCRDYALETVRSSLFSPAELSPSVFVVESVSEMELSAIAQQVPALTLPLNDARMRSLLRTPYLLDMASRMSWSESTMPRDVRDFREKCWRELVRNDAHTADGLPQRREDVFIDVARRRAAALRPYVKPSVMDAQALDALRAASLLARSPESDRFFAPAHDVLEDWAILKWLDTVSLEDDRASALAEAVAGLPAVRRGLRRWLAERLETEPEEARDFVARVTERRELPQYFRDDCVVAALLSDTAPEFVHGCRDRVMNGDCALLRELVHLLRVACKTAPSWSTSRSLPSSLLVATGPAWAPILELVATAIDSISPADALLALALVEDWASQITIAAPPAAGVEAAGRIVSALVPRFDGYGHDETRKRTFTVLLKIPGHAPIFGELAKRAIENHPDNHVAREFGELAVGSFTSAFVSRDFPETVCDILRARLLMTEGAGAAYSPYASTHDVDECFGIHDRMPLEFFPASSLQGPFHSLLIHQPRKTLPFIIEVLNHAGDWYGNRRWPGNDLEPAERITIDIPDTGTVEQWLNGRLYALHRGMTVGPYVLKSLLMALEKWLLLVAEMENVDFEAWLLYILRQSNNVMATSVVASVCVAHPSRAGRAALAILSSRDLIQLDMQRMAAESTAFIELFPMSNPSHAIYEAERKASNKLAHRREDLEAMAVRLQLTERRDEVWKLIDAHRANLAGDEDDDETLKWRLALHRMDLRGFRKVEPPPGAERPSDAPAGDYYGPGELEPAVKNMVDTARLRLNAFDRHLKLLNAATRLWSDRTSVEAAEWRSLLAEARNVAKEPEPPERYLAGGPGIVAAACVRDHLRDLDGDELRWCVDRVLKALEVADERHPDSFRYSRAFGPDRAAAAVAALIVAKSPSSLTTDPLDFLSAALCHPIQEVCEYAFGGAGAFLGDDSASLLVRCAAAAVCEAHVREEALTRRRTARQFDVDGAEVDAGVKNEVRLVLELDDDSVHAAIDSLKLESSYGRLAARHIVSLLHGRTSWDSARLFFSKVVRWLADVMRDDRRASSRPQRDYHAEAELTRAVARFAVRLPAEAAREMCAPLVAMVDKEPREAAKVIDDLISAADGGSNDCFWALWQDFADRIAAAPWLSRLDRDRPLEADVINRICLSISWKDGVTHWARLDGEAQRVHRLAAKLPSVPATVEAYARFLFSIGQQSLPDAFVDVDALVRRGDAARLVTNTNVAYYLEALLGRFVYAQPYRLKTNARLFESVLRLLDALVIAGSSAAYRMRDDFVTPVPTGVELAV